MDLDSYVGRYTGETRLQRLLLIVKKCSDQETALQALKLLEQQVKADGNVRLYKEIFGTGDGPWTMLRTQQQQEDGSSDNSNKPSSDSLMNATLGKPGLTLKTFPYYSV